MSEAEFQAWSGVAPGTLATVIATVIALLYLTWLAWVALSQYKAWAKGGGEPDLGEVAWLLIRGTVVVMVVGFFIRP